ncbi:hypothetical protein M409DRAFT_24973 [Zasmidium cellare ATCC 36951]|uniref:Aquaporin-like protein n=1 Tax=Zasmidium cellare ATCC 36951 TaxID=1080233 RepID=A0A6A6CBK8_ZASCE|nr:uncharacterized protein M409DRAFT_24973 [Zasmidium cellare ATCC 36951]KAF2164577.1 hypothetical protein M409DRAFT_24973 [Zasmidium cellare ATCC 36951]
MDTVGVTGLDDGPQLRQAHENYVHPGYVELNPAYEQPASSKPVWSLAKPLPRVIRPGMVPTREELKQVQQGPILPRQNTMKIGVDVNPLDLEEGRIEPTPNPAKLSAQLKDSRAQRENNFITNIQRRGTTLSTRPTRASSTASQTAGRRPRGSSWASQRPMTPAQETDEPVQEDGDDAKKKSSDQLEVPQADEQTSRLSLQRTPEDRLDTIPESHEATPRRSYESNDSNRTFRPEDDPEFFPENDLKQILEGENPPLYDEVHNNHTSWSIVRTHNREFLAELLAVFIQLTLGFCSDTSATLTSTANANTTAWAWGFATMIGIYISGGISGAHLNPAITIMLWFYRGFPKRKMLPYFAAQFLGAFIAALTAYGLYLASIQTFNATGDSTKILNGFVTSQRYTYIDAATAFFNEFMGTAILAATVLALGDDQNAPPGAGMNSLIIGLVITALNFGFAFQTGAAMNPSRDFGPRLAMLALGYGRDLFTNPYWFYGPFAGTISGAMVGAALYDICIFTGGESPINYPWTRTKRSYKKGKAKWARRLHLAKPKKDEEFSGGPYGLEPVS